MYPRSGNAHLKRFFAGLTEYAFETQLGVADTQLIDYITELLARFVHADHVFAVRDPAGRPLAEVTEMMIEAEARVGSARRKVHQHIGDYTLYWAGLYPEAIQRMRRPGRMDHFVDYCQQGKRSYLIASRISEDTPEDAVIFERLSHDFDLCVYGLGEVRREWQRQEGDDRPKPFLVD